jgi:hypothetical protein
MTLLMKFFIVLVCAVAIACSACKLKTSLTTQNGAASPPQPSPSLSIAHPDQTSNCSLTKAEAPLVNGLKLGMTAEEVLAEFPGSNHDPELQSQLKRSPSGFGVSNFVVRPERLEPKNKFAAFSQFTFNLLDGRVSSVNIGYNGPAYTRVDQFVTKLVEGTNLPPVDQWQTYSGMDNQLKLLTCKDFEMRVFAGGKDGNLNYVLLTDLEADKQLKDRRAKARAQASPLPAATQPPSP